MNVAYELQDLSQTEVSWIIDQLLLGRIPHIVEGDTILINKSDESEADQIISQLGKFNVSDSADVLGNSHVSTPAWKKRLEHDHPELFQPAPTKLKPIRTSASRKTMKTSAFPDEGGPFAMVGMIIGGMFGILIVIAAFLDPTYQGRIYLFLPALIFAGVGMAIGMGIEWAIKTTRRKTR